MRQVTKWEIVKFPVWTIRRYADYSGETIADIVHEYRLIEKHNRRYEHRGSPRRTKITDFPAIHINGARYVRRSVVRMVRDNE